MTAQNFTPGSPKSDRWMMASMFGFTFAITTLAHSMNLTA